MGLRLGLLLSLGLRRLLRLSWLSLLCGVDVVGGGREDSTGAGWGQDGTWGAGSSSYPPVRVRLLQWETHWAVLSIAMFPVSDYLP